jgi:hypothetical protein
LENRLVFDINLVIKPIRQFLTESFRFTGSRTQCIKIFSFLTPIGGTADCQAVFN